MKKVVHLLASNSYSGAEKVAIDIIMNLQDFVDSIYCSPRGPINETLETLNIDHFKLEKFSVSEINKMLDKLNPDIIHAHDYRASMILSISKFKGEVISHIHQNSPVVSKFSLWSIAHYISSFKFCRIVTVSDSISNEFYFRKLKRKSVTIYNYVDSEYVKNLSLIGDNLESFDLAFFGRLNKEKNPLEFIEIFAAIAKNNPMLKGVIIGDGPLLEKCVSTISDLGLNIKVLGFQSNPFKFIVNSKIVISTSLWEGFGLSVIESLCLGIPVLAPPVGGLNEIFDSFNYFLCESREEFIRKSQEILEIGSDKTQIKLIADPYINREKWIKEWRSVYNDNRT